MATQRDGFKTTVDRNRVGAGVHVSVSRGSRDAGAASAIAPVDGHAGAHERNGDGLVGGIGLPSGDKRALVRLLLRVGRPELSRKSGIANRSCPATGVDEEKDQGRRHCEHAGPRGAVHARVSGQTGAACSAHCNPLPQCDITPDLPKALPLIHDRLIRHGIGGAGWAFTDVRRHIIWLWPNFHVLQFGVFIARGWNGTGAAGHKMPLIMAGLGGFEPPTAGLKVRCSTWLSHRPRTKHRRVQFSRLAQIVGRVAKTWVAKKPWARPAAAFRPNVWLGRRGQKR